MAFANLKVKINYCDSCKSNSMFQLVESELYGKYRRTFGKHNINIEGVLASEKDGRFQLDLQIDNQQMQRIWDNSKQGDIHEDNVNQLLQIVEGKIQEQKTNK
ncbi:hypothetical protein ABPG74_008930 [Tetrahymena malaccensis]